MSSTIAGRAKQEIGLPVADFTLPLISGEGLRGLTGALKEKKGAVVIFWSGICSHCLRYDEYLNSFNDRHPDLALLVVASRYGETPDQIRKVAATRHLNFPILEDAAGALAREWYTQQTPRVFLVDADCKLLYRGAIDNFQLPEDSQYVAYLEPAIASFLSGSPVLRTETPSFGCPIQTVYYTIPKPL